MPESLLEVPEIEDVAEKVPYITSGRIARKLSVEAIKMFATEGMIRRGILPTQKVKGILEGLKSQADSKSVEWKIVFDHLFPIRNQLYLMANTKAHPDTWMRDDEYSFEFIENPVFQDHTLSAFEKRQRANGQIPTAVGILGSTPWHYADDESTLLYLISSANLIKHDPSTFLTPSRQESIERALGFVQKHIVDGMYVTPKGERRGWLDAFIHPTSDVIAQNQGLLTVALMAASNMGYPVHTQELKKAKGIYKKLAENSGYMPYSAKFPKAIGPGSLYPDYLAITRYSEALLSDKAVSETIANLARNNHGIKVLTTSPKGDYFDRTFFVTGYKKGDYQNGGNWVRWNNSIMADGELHGVLGGNDRNYRKNNLNKLNQTDWSESEPTVDYPEGECTPRRPWLVWNIAVPAEHRTVDRTMGKTA